MSIPNRNNLSDKMLRLGKTLFVTVLYPHRFFLLNSEHYSSFSNFQGFLSYSA